MMVCRAGFAALALAVAPATHAGNIDNGRAKAVACAACHGAEGESPNDLWPDLAGQKEGYLRKQLLAYRDGARVDPMMSPMAKPLTDEEIDDLAAYFGSLTAE
jgi:cytochrome c553